MARTCPQCTMEMSIEAIGDIQLDICPACAGTWFDASELRTLLARDPLALSMIEDKAVPVIEQKSAGPSLKHCPECQLPLEQYHYLYNSPIVLDTCADCGGMWVEDGELNEIQEWMEPTHRSVSTQEEIGLAVAQVKFEHDKTMQRHYRLRGLFDMLCLNRPGWLN